MAEEGSKAAVLVGFGVNLVGKVSEGGIKEEISAAVAVAAEVVEFNLVCNEEDISAAVASFDRQQASGFNVGAVQGWKEKVGYTGESAVQEEFVNICSIGVNQGQGLAGPELHEERKAGFKVALKLVY